MKPNTQTNPTCTSPSRFLSLAAATACLWLLPGALQAATWPSLVWNSNPEQSVTGYKVYVGSSSGVYPTVLTVTGATRTVLPTVPMGSKMYIRVSAVTFDGVEGNRSSELVIIADTPSPVVSPSFNMSSPGQGKIQWKYPKSSSNPAKSFTVYSSPDLVNWTPATEMSIGSPTSSDSQWLYFGFNYQANKPQMFFKVGATNPFGETL